MDVKIFLGYHIRDKKTEPALQRTDQSLLSEQGRETVILKKRKTGVA